MTKLNQIRYKLLDKKFKWHNTWCAFWIEISGRFIGKNHTAFTRSISRAEHHNDMCKKILDKQVSILTAKK
jgi:hypothetical protein